MSGAKLIERVRAEEELERLVSVLSHDLREPLRAVTGFSELLEREAAGRLGPRGDELLAMIRQGADRMETLLDGLSRYGRAGLAAAEGGPADTAAALDAALAARQGDITARGAVVTFDALPLVRAAPGALQVLLEQLIDNALKFNASPAPHIHVRAVERSAGQEIVVSDDGIGIPERERVRVFEMFRQLHPRGTYPGVGAGLAICRRVAERSGGRIWIEDAKEGTAVHVLLPDGPPA